jgi:hypothetical protein
LDRSSDLVTNTNQFTTEITQFFVDVSFIDAEKLGFRLQFLHSSLLVTNWRAVVK